MYETLQGFLEHPLVIRGLLTIVALVVVLVLINIAQRAINRYVKDPDLRYRARKSAASLGWFVLAVYLLLLFSDSLGQVGVALGVMSAGIAFALREVIMSLAGWLAITFGQFLRVGDRVQLGGTVGDVIDVGILRTTLMECREWVAGDTYTGRIVLIANSFVFSQPVYNYSMDFPFLWDEFNVPIRYGSDYDLADEILLSTAEEITGEYTDYAQKHWARMVRRYRIDPASVQPQVLLTPTDNWVGFTVRYVADYKQRRVIKDRLFRQILQRITETEGQVQFGSATHEIVGISGWEQASEDK